MVGPTRRSLRSAIASLGFCFAISGCQSVTQQKAAWSFPSFQDDIVDRASASAVENRALPPLPAGSDATPQAAKTDGLLRNTATNRENLFLSDTAIVRTSAAPGQPGTKPLSGNESVFSGSPEIPGTNAAASNLKNSTSATPEKPVLPVIRKTAATSGQNHALTKPAEPAAAVPMDPKTAGQIVKRIVGASDDLIRTGVEPEEDDGESITPLLPPPMLPGVSQGAPGKVASDSTKSAQSPKTATAAANAAARTGPARPPLETLPADSGELDAYRTKAAPAKPVLSIPRAVICKSVQGRGRFSAVAEQARVPGASIIVYWEMDDLARDLTGRTAAFTALVELVSTQRDETLASARETVRELGPKPAEGDFAALRWSIPPDLAAGDYRIRITVTEETTKRTATAQVDFFLGQSPIASRFVLP